ncbi:hypothetical protein [Arthrobacter sp. UYCu712]|uniref:hypothetical protein n=1 Tax=Arthrobacter sp. UYCu712 TaxID=3156340 RepID=UPI00339A6794
MLVHVQASGVDLFQVVDAPEESRLPGTGRADQKRRRGMARSYSIRDPQGGDFLSGAIEVGPSPYLVLDADGEAQPGFFATGVPLESVHWGTQLGPLAHTNSQFLRDSDAIAIAALAHGKTRCTHPP